MNELRKLYNLRNRIGFKISIINSVFFFLAFAVILVITSVLNYKIISKKEEQTFKAYLTNSILSVDNKLKDMSRVSLMSTTGDRVQDILLNYQKSKAYDQNQDEEYLSDYYTSLVEIRNDITGIYIYNKNALIFHHDMMNPSFRRNVNAFTAMKEVMSSSEKLQGANCSIAVASLPRFMRYMDNYERDPYYNNCIWLTRDIYSFSPYNKIGYVALTVPVATIKKTLDESIGNDMFYILLTKSGDVICCQDGSLITKNMKSISPTVNKAINAQRCSNVEWNGQLCKIMSRQSRYSNLILVVGKPVNRFAQEATRFIWFSIAIGLCVAAFIVFVTFRNVGTILKPLNSLAHEMSNFDEKSLKVQYPVTNNDEVGQLVKSFNSMVNMLDNLIETQYMNQVRIKESQLNEQKMSMLYLKSQVNPHFLYNTLDTIRIRAEINEDKDVSYMLMELVKFFRLNIRAVDQFVTLDHEFSLIDAYLKLMCYRYEKIEYQYDIDKTLMDVLVPNFILQPIVENSLLHGLRDRGYRGNIFIGAHRTEEQGRIEIIIKDNGVGFNKEVQDRVNNMLRDYENSNDSNINSIGIMNVQKRLKMFYSNDCGLLYTVNAKGGVTAHIIIEEKFDFNTGN